MLGSRIHQSSRLMIGFFLPFDHVSLFFIVIFNAASHLCTRVPGEQDIAIRSPLEE